MSKFGDLKLILNIKEIVIAIYRFYICGKFDLFGFINKLFKVALLILLTSIFISLFDFLIYNSFTFLIFPKSSFDIFIKKSFFSLIILFLSIFPKVNIFNIK